MKKKRITYGVAGMMEYQAVIKIGRSQMKVLFTDGSATGYGMNPAMYTTDNMMVQKAIENSEQFKRGHIHIVESVDLDEEESVVRNSSKESGIKSDTGTDSDAPNVPEIKEDNEDAPNVPEIKEDNEDAPGEDDESESMPLIEKEFDNNDDAKDYLEQTFGCVRSKLRNREDIKTAGAANGVSITFS